MAGRLRWSAYHHEFGPRGRGGLGCVEPRESHILCASDRFVGGESGGATPDPMPNSEVKSSSADGSVTVTWRESRSPPAFLSHEPRPPIRPDGRVGGFVILGARPKISGAGRSRRPDPDSLARRPDCPGADFGLARERAVRRCESWDVPPPLHFAQYPMGPQSPGDEVCRFELEYSDGSQRLDAGVPPAM